MMRRKKRRVLNKIFELSFLIFNFFVVSKNNGAMRGRFYLLKK